MPLEICKIKEIAYFRTFVNLSKSFFAKKSNIQPKKSKINKKD